MRTVWLWALVLSVSCGKKPPAVPPPPAPAGKTVDFLELLPDGTTQVRCVEYGALKDHELFREGIRKALAKYAETRGLPSFAAEIVVEADFAILPWRIEIARGDFDAAALKRHLEANGYQARGEFFVHPATVAAIRGRFLVLARALVPAREEDREKTIAVFTEVWSDRGASLAGNAGFRKLLDRIPAEARAFSVSTGRIEAVEIGREEDPQAPRARGYGEVRYSVYGERWENSHILFFDTEPDAELGLKCIRFPKSTKVREGATVVMRDSVAASQVREALGGRLIAPDPFNITARVE